MKKLIFLPLLIIATSSFADEAVYCEPSVDINGDGVVDIADLSILKSDFFQTRTVSNCQPNSDLNGDGIVNAADLVILKRNMEY